jgi:hypothetical protein
MARAKHPLSINLRSLRYNPTNSMYEIEEKGIVYAMPLEMTRLLNVYAKGGFIKDEEAGMVYNWYNTLSKSEKRSIVLTGDLRNEQDEYYYPDQHIE